MSWSKRILRLFGDALVGIVGALIIDVLIAVWVFTHPVLGYSPFGEAMEVFVLLLLFLVIPAGAVVGALSGLVFRTGKRRRYILLTSAVLFILILIAYGGYIDRRYAS